MSHRKHRRSRALFARRKRSHFSDCRSARTSTKRKLHDDGAHEELSEEETDDHSSHRRFKSVRRRPQYKRDEREMAPSPESSGSDSEASPHNSDSSSSGSDSGSNSGGSGSETDSSCASSSSTHSAFCSSSSNSDSDEDEIDLAFHDNPCPYSCACWATSNMAPKPSKILRTEGFKTVVPLYKKLLQRRLLRVENICWNKCCSKACNQSWTRRRPTARRMTVDYKPSDLSVCRFSWGDWKKQEAAGIGTNASVVRADAPGIDEDLEDDLI